ncbi:penicillin acylase family protein [Flavobacteriaceae bacterium]|nr:penicillin acylase family protein [Flavobacteriaceae bacterium]MDC1492082.1 penicillin acylase family protein [Flavobacteriaceae bacterium]
MYKIFIFFISASISYGQINPVDVEIVRDYYGVPHIYGKTDADTAYGLAWAHSEDDFMTIQKAYLAGNGMLSKYLKNDGIIVDFLTEFIESEKKVDELFDTLSEDFIKLIEGYSQGINKYAELNPEKVLVKELFPITPKKMLNYSFLQLFISNGADKLVSKIISNNTVNLSNLGINDDIQGSNTFAFNNNKTKNGETYLAINTHQPLDGPNSWYEVHLNSEEGTNIVGATFAGAPCVLTGVNENLAWTHTVNYPDKADLFKLKMHKSKKDIYLIDNKEYLLESYKAKLKYRIFGININIKKKYYKSIFGPTLKNKSGYYSVRTPSLYNIKALEQWWRMNKAKSFNEFYNVLKMKSIPGYNIGYADKNDTIFYISNGIIPIRNEKNDWTKIVDGSKSENLWENYYEISDLPQVINPKSGFIYNANHSPFKSTGGDENPKEEDFSKTMNYETYDNNRSTRIRNLINSEESVDYKKFKEIKYDNKLPRPLNYSFLDINSIWKINASQYPKLSDVILNIQNWNMATDAKSIGAANYGVLYYILINKFNNIKDKKIFSEAEIIELISSTKKYLLKYFDSVNIELGDFQKLVRGEKEKGIFGLPDVITAMKGRAFENGKIKITHGESYISLVKFKEGKVEIETVVSYGSSDNPNSIHYNDQMDLYSKFKTKKMTLDKKEIYKNAIRIYNPK